LSVYVLDSNIISFYLKENNCVIENIEKAINEGHSIIIAPIAYYEVKRGLLLVGATKQLKKFEELCNLFPIGELGNYLLEEATKIYVQERKEKRNTEDADILIAAFCLYNNYILVTDNTKHFKYINKLLLSNWNKQNI
jgi:tRNA(fMet)-specific endonuclease VapC